MLNEIFGSKRPEADTLMIFFPLSCLCEELLSDTPIEDSVIMVQKGSNSIARSGLSSLLPQNFGFAPLGKAAAYSFPSRQHETPAQGIEIRGDLALTEKLDALPPKKKRIRIPTKPWRQMVYVVAVCS